jgi:putative phage-type endonuclease
MNPVISELSKLPQHAQRSAEWFEQRKDKLTSSDAATALGINPYQKREELLLKKCGLDLKPFVGNIATRHGQKYEDEAIEKYCRIMGKKNYNFGLLCHKDIHNNDDYYWLAGSPDGIAQDYYDPNKEPILLEVKCPYKRKIKIGEIPKYYLPQVQLNLFICNIQSADFIEYSPPNTINIVRVKRDSSWLEPNLKILESFWKEVEHYREVGIETHPCRRQKKIIDFTDNEGCSSDTVPTPEDTGSTPEDHCQDSKLENYSFR